MRSQIRLKARIGVKQGKGKVSRSAPVSLRKRKQAAWHDMSSHNTEDKIGIAEGELCPSPKKDERPTCYADRVGSWYSERKTVEHRKGEGLYLTPVAVADFMAGLMRKKGKVIRIIDPAAGAGVLLCEAVETATLRTSKAIHMELVAYETDPGLMPPLQYVLSYLKTWTSRREVRIQY